MNFTIPNMTSPTMQRAIYPTKPPKWWGLSRLRRVISKSVLCWCLLSYSLELNLFCGSRNWREVLVFFTFLSLPFPTFFCVFLSHRSFRFRCLSRAARLEIQGFRKILPNGVEIFSKTEGSTFISKVCCHTFATCTITGWCQKERPCGGKKIRQQMKIETSRKFWTARLSHTHFWEMDTIRLANVLGKWKSHTRMAHLEKFRWKKSMACPCFLHQVFSKAVQ